MVVYTVVNYDVCLGVFTREFQAERYVKRLPKGTYNIGELKVDSLVPRTVSVDIKKVRMQGRFDPIPALKQLKQSIYDNGLISPILVKERPQTYLVINGNQRLHACRSLGFTTIDVRIVE